MLEDASQGVPWLTDRRHNQNTLDQIHACPTRLMWEMDGQGGAGKVKRGRKKAEIYAEKWKLSRWFCEMFVMENPF